MGWSQTRSPAATRLLSSLTRAGLPRLPRLRRQLIAGLGTATSPDVPRYNYFDYKRRSPDIVETGKAWLGGPHASFIGIGRHPVLCIGGCRMMEQ